MSDLFRNHIVGFPMRRLMYLSSMPDFFLKMGACLKARTMQKRDIKIFFFFSLFSFSIFFLYLYNLYNDNCS